MNHPLKTPIRANYLDPVFDPVIFSRLVEVTAARLVEISSEAPFEAIAFRGVSGAALAFPIAAMLALPLLCVRKPEESSHAYGDAESVSGALIHRKRYIILDDFISSGATVRRIVDAIAKLFPTAKCVGVLEYLDCDEYNAKYRSERVGLKVWHNPGYKALEQQHLSVARLFF